MLISDIYKKKSGLIQIKFGTTPQVGAHNPVGYDEITYTIDSGGNKEFIEYQHIKNYKLISDKWLEISLQIR